MAQTQANQCGPGGISPYPYYSTAHIGTVRSGSGPFTYTLAANSGPARLFSYQIGQAMTTAWIGDGTPRTATERDTNLQTSNETQSGDEVEIVGIGLSLAPLSSLAAKLLAHVMTSAWCKIIFDGRDAGYPLGPLTFYPGGHGLSGRALSLDMTPPLAGPPAGVGIDFVANGLPMVDNIAMLQRPFKWTPEKADSKMNIAVYFPEAIAFTSAAVTAASGVEAFTPPAAGGNGTFIEIVCKLYAKVTAGS